MNKLEAMMKEDGWKLGYYVNWGIKYWVFRKDGFDIDLDNVQENSIDDEAQKHFTPWKEFVIDKGEEK